MSAIAPPAQSTQPTADRALDDIAQDLIDVLNHPEKSDEPIHTSGLDSEGLLPGFGEAYDDCGDQIPVFCENCARDFTIGRTCKRATCPRCGAWWCRDKSTNVVAKLMAYRAQRDANREKPQRFHHLVFSPDWDRWRLAADDPLDRTLHVVRDLLSVLDLQGVVCTHPHRGIDGDDLGAWKERLFNDRSWRDVSEELYLSPHFHALVVGHFVPGEGVVERVEEETGWAIHRVVRGDSNTSIYGTKQLAAAVTYALSHTQIRQTDNGNWSAQYRYYGKELNNVEVYDRTKREADQIVRAISTRTLGLRYETQACVADNQVDDSTHDYVGRVTLSDNADGDDDGDDDGDLDDPPAVCTTAPVATSSPSGFNLDTYAGEVDRPNPDALRLEDHIPPAADTGGSPYVKNLPPKDAPGPYPEQETCRGRILPISKAPDYINDDDWWAHAPYADELRETYDEWRPKIDWLPDEDPIDRPPPD